MTRVAYLGTWHHIQIAKDLLQKGIKEFVCIDTQPRSEFDQPAFFPEFYRQKFTNDLLTKCKEFGFGLVSSTILDPDYIRKIGIASEVIDTELRKNININTVYKDACPTLLTFKNEQTEQTIRYYISTNIETNICQQLKDDLHGCRGLILSGYFPHKCILNYLPKDIEYYCYTQTIYEKDEDRIDKIIDVLENGTFHLIDYTTGHHLSTHSSMDEIRAETSMLRELQLY